MRILTYALCDAVVKRVRDALAERYDVVAANRKALVSPANRHAIYLLNITRDTSLLTVFIEYHMYLLLWPLRRKLVVFFASDYVDLCRSSWGKAVAYCLNCLVLASARLVLLLPSRSHIVQRYKLPKRKVLFFENFPGPEFEPQPAQASRGPLAGRTVILYHGSCLWWHGFLGFLPILDRVRQTHPEAMLVVVGAVKRNQFLDLFAYEREFFDRMAEARDRDDILWVPRVEPPNGHIADYIAQADLHVSQLDNTSVQGDTELRTCLLEAMAMGVPCLHVDSHAIRTHPEFEDGVNIVLIDPADPDAAARGICALLDAPGDLRRIGDRGRRTIQEHYDFDAWLDRTLVPRLERLAET